MSWNPNNGAVRVILALALAGAASGALADTIVVRSTGPSAKSYPPGKSLAENSRIALQAGDSLVLLDGRGTRTLKGPGAFSSSAPTSGGTESRTSLAALTGGDGSARRARIGAVRGTTTGPTRSPSIWFIDTGKSGNVCVADPSAVQLWRSDSSAAGATTLSGSGGASATLQWAEGQSSAPWPASLPIASGAEYRVSGGAIAATLKFAMLKPSPTGIEDMASALIKNGCDAQLNVLIETVSVPGSDSAG